MRYDLLDEDDFRMFAGRTKREIRRAYGLNLKISRLMLEDAFRAWYPMTKALIEGHERMVDRNGEIDDPLLVLGLMRHQVGFLCSFLGGQRKLLTVTRDTPKDPDLVDLLGEGFAQYSQELFAILVCGHILRVVTYALVGREIVITDQVFLRLVQLARRGNQQISSLRELADILDPLDE